MHALDEREDEMTQKEAKTKWCPMVRLAWALNGGSAGYGNTAITANRWGSGDPLEGSLCIGSACMMWQWEIAPYPGDNQDDGIGFCGLAGKP